MRRDRRGRAPRLCNGAALNLNSLPGVKSSALMHPMGIRRDAGGREDDHGRSGGHWRGE